MRLALAIRSIVFLLSPSTSATSLILRAWSKAANRLAMPSIFFVGGSVSGVSAGARVFSETPPQKPSSFFRGHDRDRQALDIASSILYRCDRDTTAPF